MGGAAHVLIGADGGRIEAASLWIHVDPETGRPKRLDATFLEAYAEAVAGRAVGSRLAHPDPPPDAADGPAWSVRRSDLDLFDHVNNAAFWAVAEEAWPVDRLAVPWRAEIEHRDGLVHGQAASVRVHGNRLWVLADGVVAASLVVDEG